MRVLRSAFRSHRWNLLTLGAASVLALVLGEVTLRTVLPSAVLQPTSAIYARSDVPGLGYTYRPGFRGRAFGVPLAVNPLGFRGPRWSRPHEPGVDRIALVGDSHAFGFGVAMDRTSGEVLARRLARRTGRPAETLNFGVNGYNAAQQAAVVDLLVPQFAPDVTVLVVSSNDHQDPFEVDAEGHLVGRDDRDRPFRVLDRSIAARTAGSRSALLRTLGGAWRRWRATSIATEPGHDGVESATGTWLPPVAPAPATGRLAPVVGPTLGSMIESSRSRGSRVVVACFCVPADYRRLLRQVERDHAVPVVELLAVLPGVASWEEVLERYSLGWDPHLGAEAHAIWGRALADAVAPLLEAPP